MLIIPTLEILNGRCVSLVKGNMQDPHVWHVDPIETAQTWVAEGAQQIRVTDFDALSGAPGNDDLIGDLIRAVGVPVQVAGGIRTADHVAGWSERGAAQVVIGTWAAQAPDDVMALAKYHPDMIVLSLDLWQGKLMTHGWGSESALDPTAFLQSFAGVPLSAVVITDIDSDATEVDKQVGVIAGLAAQTRHRVIASGMVDSADDLARLKFAGGLDGALVGRALMRKSLTMPQALEIAQPVFAETAAFQ